MCDQGAPERLAAYERMYRDLLQERDAVLARMAELRAAGKERGATYRQLMAQKLTVQELLRRFAVYGIREL